MVYWGLTPQQLGDKPTIACRNTTGQKCHVHMDRSYEILILVPNITMLFATEYKHILKTNTYKIHLTFSF